MSPRRCIIVLGMHRSGTSAMTGVLSKLGIYPGNSLLPPVEKVNPKGFWEHSELVSIHDQLLDTLGSSWTDESSLPDEWWLSPLVTPFRNNILDVLIRDFFDHPIWLVKDPRLCRLLPLWLDILHEINCQPMFVITLRHPSEIAHSLLTRDKLPEASSCLLWLTYMLEAEYLTRETNRAFVAYESLLADWRGTMSKISQTLGLAWPVQFEDAGPDVETFLSPTLRHHVDSAPLPSHLACRLAQQGFEVISSTTRNTSELDRLRTQAKELAALVAPWSGSARHYRRLEASIAHLEAENKVLHGEVKRIKSSVSWIVTKPLRLLRRLFVKQ